MLSPRSRVIMARAWRLAASLALIVGLFFSAAPLQRVQATAGSGIVFDGSPGTAAPPATLGPYTMIPFPADSRPLGDVVTTVPGPTGDLSFDHIVVHVRVGSGWEIWSHGYTGDAYWGPNQVTISLPAGTRAFYFYAEPAVFDVYQITATAQDGTTSGPIDVDGSAGAAYFGFYSMGAPLATITVSSDVYLLVGEFGIDGSAPGHCTRADVSVKIYGGWDGIPVNAYVGGNEQETLYTAHDAFGEPAVLWTFYPPATGWNVSVTPELPAGLDPDRWQYKLVRIVADGSAVENPGAASATVYPCAERVFYFQLTDTGALPPEE